MTIDQIREWRKTACSVDTGMIPIIDALMDKLTVTTEALQRIAKTGGYTELQEIAAAALKEI